MRLIRNLVLFLAGLAIVLAAAAYLLPRNVIVERSVTISAAPDAIFPHVNSLEKAAAWSPWLKRDPATKLTFEGPAEGVGNKMTWMSENAQVGSGTQEITASQPGERVESTLNFDGMGTSTAWFVLVPEGAATKVTWSLDADMGNNPIGRWMGLMMDRWVGADYESGLANLKALVEGG